MRRWFLLIQQQKVLALRRTWSIPLTINNFLQIYLQICYRRMAILRATLFWGKACRRNGSQGLFHRNPFFRKGLSRIFLERVAATLSRSSCIINMKIYFLIANFACFILLYFFATHLRDADIFYTASALFHFWSFMPDKIRAETNFKIVHFFVNEISFSTHKLKKSDLKLSHLAANRENRRCNITSPTVPYNTSWTNSCGWNHNLQTKKKVWIGTLLTT